MLIGKASCLNLEIHWNVSYDALASTLRWKIQIRLLCSCPIFAPKRVNGDQGDHIEWFSPIGLLLETHYDFLKGKIAQNNGDFLGYYLFKQIYDIFTYISSFKTWFVVGILRFWKWFDVDVLGFQIHPCCRYFGLFWLGNFLGYSLKNLANFFLII